MDPPIKLFGQTIAFTTSASSQEDALDGLGTTSSGAWEELSSSQDGIDNGAESVVKSELANNKCPSGSLPELSSSGSDGARKEKTSSSPCGVYGLVLPFSEASEGGASGTECVDVEGFGEEDDVNGDDVGGKGAKMPRRPGKAVACPRCLSLETKFCYYNNYNVNQPRHFCKHCQRYWTAGGTLRNVPVGAGRRKNKHGSVVSPRQTSEMGLVRSDEPDVAAPLLVGKGVHLPVPLKQLPAVQNVAGVSRQCSPKALMQVPASGGTSDSVGTLPYSMRVPSLEATYILASGEAVKPTDSGGLAGSLLGVSASTSGFSDVPRSANEVDVPCDWPSKDGSAGPTLIRSVKGGLGATTTTHMKDGDVTAAWNSGGGASPGSHCATGSFGFFNGGWPYGYNVGWNAGAAFCTGGIGSVGTAMAPPTSANVAAWGGSAAGNMWTGVPWPMPGLSWSPAGWGPSPWSMSPWAMGAAAPIGTAVALTASVPSGGASTVPTSVPYPTGPIAASSSLGKHARPSSFEGGIADGTTVWAPKSLRMADPEEAMRSSVWRISGVGSQAPDLTTASTFKAFQPKSESKKIPDGDQQTVQATLHANPAAMSRSMYFHESN